MKYFVTLFAGKDVDDALEDQNYKRHSRSAISKARALFKKQKKSSQAADHIRANCGGRLFELPNATRWNSFYDAMKRLKTNLDESDDNLNGLMDLLGIKRFVPTDITFITEYVNVYKLFANVLDVLQGDKNIGSYVGALLPLLSGLCAKLEEASRSTEICGPLAQALIKGINHRFWNDFSTDKLYIAAAGMLQYIQDVHKIL